MANETGNRLGASSGHEGRFDAEVQRACDIYRRLFPEREVRIAFYKGDDPAYGDPQVFDQDISIKYETYRPEFCGTKLLPGPKPQGRAVTVAVSIPRAPTHGELEHSNETWPTRLWVKALFAVSPGIYEQVRYAFEAWRKQKRLPGHKFSVPLHSRALKKFNELPAETAPVRPAILIGFHWLEVGGAEKLAFDTVTWALEAGLRVFVVAAVPAMQRLTHKLPDHPDVTFLRLDRYLAHDHWPKYLEHLVKDEGIRLIHIHHCGPLYASLEHLRKTTPWVEVIDTTHIIEYAGGGYPQISGVHTNLIDLHHVISLDLKDFYREKFHVSEKVKLGRIMDVEADPVDLPDVSMTTRGDTLTAAFVGRMVYQKRPIVLVKILQRLAAWAARNGVSFRATVVGDGPFKPTVEKLVRRYGLSDVVTLAPGHVDVPALLRESDILLLPSNNEGLALVCYEAIEQGCIPISTDVGAQREIVPESLLVPWNPVGTIRGTLAVVDRLWRDAGFLAESQAALHARYRSLAADMTAKALLSEVYQTVAKGDAIASELTMPSEVTAVVVTFNRSGKLMNVLDALAEQTVRPKRIFVVDNASTDDTRKLVEKRAVTMTNLRYMRLEKNFGGAGGFHEGIKAAYMDGANYIWISDDDAYPKPDTIEKLRDALLDFEAAHGRRPSFACSRVEWTNGSICEMNVPNTVWDWARFVDGENTRPLVDSCSFVSVLVPRWAVKAHGLPIPDYFIWFDDAEYTRRISRSYPGIFVPESQVIHDLPENKGVNYSLITASNVWKFRYGARNETSYRLRETGIPGALAFAYKVHKEMKAGKVSFALRRQIYGALWRGWTFRPAIPPAPTERREDASSSVQSERNSAVTKTRADSRVRQDRRGLKTLYLHIGHYKTGTSAIQDYLSKNAEALREHGYLYPAAARPMRNNTNHGHLSLTVARDHGFVPPAWYGEHLPADDAYAAFREEVNRAREDRIIVSSEEFVQLALQAEPEKALADLKERLAGFDVKVVFYIREPFSLLKSWFNQVNKGPVGTRNFPTFFMNLKPQFLAQEAIWRHFAEAFGEENMIVLAYKKVGADHIKEFLHAIGCDHEPMGEVNPLNEAEPISTLELSRLAKDRKHSYDEATVTSIEDVEKFINKVNRVSLLYNEVAARSDENRPSRLTPVAVIEHYRELLAALREVTQLNQLEADRMLDLALQAEATDLGLATALMSVAHIIRPHGDFINQKLEAYRAALHADASTNREAAK